MNRLSKNEIGFMLVELIVVMALLAVLAVLAVIGITRFAGITDKTRLEADYYLAASIATSTQAWLAEGDSTYTNNTISIQDLKDDKYLIESIDYKAQTNDKFFTIDYNHADNSIKVKAGTQQFYPVP